MTNASQPVMKRRIALLQTLERLPEAIRSLAELLNISPTDAEAWTELSALYMAQGMFAQASYCLEEVLLVYPNAWNVGSPRLYPLWQMYGYVG